MVNHASNGLFNMNAMGENLRGNQGILGFGSKLVVRWPLLRDALNFCFFEALFFIAYRFGMSFSHACASPFWFPDSVLLCALLLNRRRRWWIFLLAPLPIRLFVAISLHLPLWFLLATFAIDSVKGLATAMALQRFIRNPLRFETVREFVLYCLFAVALVPAVSAFAGAAARHVLGHDYWSSWEQWFMGDALTHLIVTPAIFYLVLGVPWVAPLPSRRRFFEAAAMMIGLILSAFLAFNTESIQIGLTESRLYAPALFLFWAAIRFGMIGISGAITIMVIIAAEAAIRGYGLFVGLSPSDTALALQNSLLVRAAPLYVVAILIEQKSGVERSLRESEARFRNMADTAPVMIWMSAPDKTCIYFNQRWLDFTGRPLESEIGDGWVSNIHPEDVATRVAGYKEAFDSREAFTVEYRLRRSDGQYRWILTHAVPRVAVGGEFVGYVGTCLDITDRKQMEEANRNLAHASRVSTMGQLASALAHELSQPLGAILRNAEAGELMLKQNPPDHEEMRSLFADICQDDRRAGAVIDRMRSLLKRRNLEFERLSVNQLINQVMVLVRTEMLTRRVTLVVDLPPDLLLVRGDRVHLQQVLLNLLVNGADAMSGSLSEDRKLEVRAHRTKDQMVEVAVRDFGHGIPAEKLAQIFEPFYTTKSHGMGMGLAISRTIVESHGGRIWAENNGKAGATFRFTLAVAERGDGA